MERVPEFFHSRFGESLKCRLGIKCRNYIWPAKYDQESRKIYGLRSFMRYYGFGVYSVAQFDYYGDGMFEVKLFRETADECNYPKQHPNEFVKTKDKEPFYVDDYLLDFQSIESEKRFSLFCFNGCRNTTAFVEMRIINLNLHSNVMDVKLASSWEKFYRDWKDGSTVVLRLAHRKWEVEVKWINGSCFFTKGWLEFAKETEIQEGDVLLVYESEKIWNTSLNVCIFKAEFLPRLVNKKHFEKLYRMNQIYVGGESWFIFYNERNGYIRNLQDMMKRFNVMEKDAIVFCIDDSNVLTGRIYRSDGMEIQYQRNDQNMQHSYLDDWFLKPDIDFESGVLWLFLSSESEYSAGGEDELDNEMQFTIKISSGVVDKRSHGVCIPKNIHPPNHEWKKGDETVIETDKGIWTLGLVIHHTRARFCSGWNKFVRDNGFKVNDVLHWRLIEEEGSPKFVVIKL
ncbi:hypothetical protein ACET3Z_023371 [Daucus carota]